MSRDIPELEGIKQTGITEDEVRRIGSKATGAAFLRERLGDIDTLADPALQESIRQMEADELIDIRPQASPD